MNKARKKGFTLIELIAVIAILVILGAILVPNVLGYRKKAEKANIQTSAKTIISAIDTYNADKDALSDQIGDGSGNYLGTMDYATGIASLNEAGVVTSSKIPDALSGTGEVKNVAQLCEVADGKFDVVSVNGKASSISMNPDAK